MAQSFSLNDVRFLAKSTRIAVTTPDGRVIWYLAAPVGTPVDDTAGEPATTPQRLAETQSRVGNA